jgi:hypothetical protein
MGGKINISVEKLVGHLYKMKLHTSRAIPLPARPLEEVLWAIQL